MWIHIDVAAAQQVCGRERVEGKRECARKSVQESVCKREREHERTYRCSYCATGVCVCVIERERKRERKRIKVRVSVAVAKQMYGKERKCEG